MPQPAIATMLVVAVTDSFLDPAYPVKLDEAVDLVITALGVKPKFTSDDLQGAAPVLLVSGRKLDEADVAWICAHWTEAALLPSGNRQFHLPVTSGPRTYRLKRQPRSNELALDVRQKLDLGKRLAVVVCLLPDVIAVCREVSPVFTSSVAFSDPAYPASANAQTGWGNVVDRALSMKSYDVLDRIITYVLNRNGEGADPEALRVIHSLLDSA